MRLVCLLFALLALAHAASIAKVLNGDVEATTQFDDTDEVNRIRDLLFRNVSKNLDQPQLCFLVGGIASGKSTALRSQLPGWGFIPERDRVHLGLSRILMHLDGWDSTDRCASPRLFDHALELHRNFFEEAVRSRTNVLFEGELTDSAAVKSMIEFALARRYTVNVVGATVATSTAAQRAVQQSRASGRWHSLEQVVSSHARFSSAFPSLLLPDQVNCTLLFDTTVPGRPLLILNDTYIAQPERFSAFLSKASDTEENIKGTLRDMEKDAFHDLCSCSAVDGVDHVVCGGGKDDKDHDLKKSRNRWRAASVAFMVLAGLFLLAMMALAYRYSQLRKQHMYEDGHPGASYEPRPAVTSYQRMSENA